MSAWMQLRPSPVNRTLCIHLSRGFNVTVAIKDEFLCLEFIIIIINY